LAFSPDRSLYKVTASLASLCFDQKAKPFFFLAVLPSTLLLLTLCFCARIAAGMGHI